MIRIFFIAGLELKRKWSNCRDYYKKDKQKLKSCPTGSAAKKGKRYVFADILSFLDKVVTKRNHEGNYNDDNNDELDEVTQNAQTIGSEGEDQMDGEKERTLEHTKAGTIRKKNASEEPEIKKKKTKDVPGEILNILQNKRTTSPRDYDDDEKYLLSFSGDMKKMTHSQKIDFKLGMMQLLKNTFKVSVPSISPYYIIQSSTPSPGSSYSSVYQNSFQNRSATQDQQLGYTTLQNVIMQPPQPETTGQLGSDRGQYEIPDEDMEYREPETSQTQNRKTQLSQNLTFI